MSILVTDTGFAPAPEVASVPLADIANHQGALDLANTDDPALLAGHLGNISLRLGRDVQWDPQTERFKNDEKANEMLSRPMRKPWTL